MNIGHLSNSHTFDYPIGAYLFPIHEDIYPPTLDDDVQPLNHLLTQILRILHDHMEQSLLLQEIEHYLVCDDQQVYPLYLLA
jgi:hypothetical protein